MQLRVIDLDGSLPDQPAIRDRLLDESAVLANFRAHGPALRVIATRRGMGKFVAGLDEVFGQPSGEPEMYLYGSGDFHHATAALISRVREPVTVIHFDNHPDWCRFPANYNCGAWVNRALEMAHVARVITLGPCSGDMIKPEWQSANLPALSAGRLEVYPWRAAPSKVWWRYPDTACGRCVDGHIHWRTLEQEPWGTFIDQLIARLPQTALWITIDKDVLRPEEATTNWDQGQMRVDHVIDAVERLSAARRIAGIDICGEHSQPVFANVVQATIARMDNPPGAAPSTDALAINGTTNGRLIEAFQRLARQSARVGAQRAVVSRGFDVAERKTYPLPA